MADSLRLDPDTLTPRDFKRARQQLGIDPYEVLASDIHEDRLTLIIWCLKSRTDPDFTLEQAEDTPFGEFNRDDGPPPIPSAAANGGSLGRNGEQPSSTTPTVPVPAPSSATTTG